MLMTTLTDCAVQGQCHVSEYTREAQLSYVLIVAFKTPAWLHIVVTRGSENLAIMLDDNIKALFRMTFLLNTHIKMWKVCIIMGKHMISSCTCALERIINCNSTKLTFVILVSLGTQSLMLTPTPHPRKAQHSYISVPALCL